MRASKSVYFCLLYFLIGSMTVFPLIFHLAGSNQPPSPQYNSVFLPHQPHLNVMNQINEEFVTGLGNNLNSALYTNISDTTNLNLPFLEAPGRKYFDLEINAYHQNITRTNLTFSGINAENTTYVIEDYPENFVTNADNPYLQVWGAMSIKISTPCILQRVWAFVQEVDPAALWNIMIYNATRELSEELMVIPDSPTGISILQPATESGLLAAHWQNFTFPDVKLNITNTYVDANGFAYYFLVLAFPIFNPLNLNYSFLYISFDEVFIDDGYLYGGVVGVDPEYLDADACIKLDITPISSTPTPSEIGLAVKNPQRPPSTNMILETNHTLPLGAAYLNETTQLLAQNFTLTEYATIEDISVYLKVHGNASICRLGILPNNDSALGPMWDANLVYDLNNTIDLEDGTEGWYNFTMLDRPNLAPGQYWWVMLTETSGNITVYGTDHPTNSNIVALNVTGDESGGEIVLTAEVINNSAFATIIYYRPGIDYFSVTNDWTYDSYLMSDIFGNYHYYISTRWQGTTTFDVYHNIELENNGHITPIYHANFEDDMITWNLSLNAVFPTTDLGMIINITIPRDWTVLNVTIGGQDHGNINWSALLLSEQQLLSIRNASSGFWTIWCSSPKYTMSSIIESYEQGQYTPALNATVYDRLGVNISIPNQSTGMCHLRIFYPDNETTFQNQTSVTTEQNYFYWFPENDSKATGGIYTFVVYWFNGTELGFNRQFFTFVPIPSNLTIVSSIPSPYVDDFTQYVLIRYNDSRGVNIAGATLSANLSTNPLEWDDVYSKTMDLADIGLYKIKLNTNGLNANQYYALNVSAMKVGYEKVTTLLTQILIAPVPTSLNIAIQNITQFTNEAISFSCSYKDTFHGIDIDWANVSYQVIGTNISGYMDRIMLGESVYEATDVLLNNLIGSAIPYQLNITAVAANCQIQSQLIDLYVRNKTQTRLHILSGSESQTHIQGQTLLVRAQLQNASSLEGLPNASIRFTFGGVIPDLITLTDQNGIAEVEISIPNQPITIEVYYDETLGNEGSMATPLSINVITYVDIALWIGIIIGVCVAAVLAYRQLYVKPRRKRKMQQFQKVANKFQDIANLKHILILHRESAGCLYQQSLSGELDGDLISGFLHAISTFQTELTPTKISPHEIKTGGFELTYQDYKIFLFHGDNISLALIFDEPPSNQFRVMAKSFVQSYEDRYRDVLVKWHGDVTPFKNSYEIFAEKLEISLLWPHQINYFSPNEKFSALENSLIKIADMIMKSQAAEYFFLPLVISTAAAGQPQLRLEVIATVYNLTKRKTFVPINPEKVD